MIWPFNKKKEKMIAPDTNHKGTRLSQEQYDELITSLEEGLPPSWNEENKEDDWGYYDRSRD